MKIIYNCYGSSHSSVTAAAIHAGLLPMNRIPDYQEFLSIPHYDTTTSGQIGIPFFMGYDEFNNEIYCLGMAFERELVTRVINSYLMETKNTTKDILLVHSLVIANIFTKVGGFTSRKMGLVCIGRPLTILGIRQRYFQFVKLVNNIKSQFQN